MEIINPWFLYFWTRLDAIIGVSITGAIFSGVTILIGLFVVLVGIESPREEDVVMTGKDLMKKAVFPFLVFLLLSVGVPNKKDAAIIYVIPKLANSETIQQEAGDIYRYAKAALKESLPEMKEKE